MIRLIATDLDGTLLEEDGTLPKGTFETIRQLNTMGICVAASSGRQYGNLRRLFAPVAELMAFISENGALCVVEGREAAVIPVPDAFVREALADYEALGMNVLLSGKHTCYLFDCNRSYTDDIVYRLRNTATIVSSIDEIEEPILKVSGQLDGF